MNADTGKTFGPRHVYLRPLSMETDGTVCPAETAPEVSFAFDTTVTYLGGAAYEVLLRLQVEGYRSSRVCYLCEVEQAGFFLIRGFQGRALDVVLEVNSPFQLFPYAASAAKAAIRRAGFRPELPERVELTGGTDDFRRGTADINQPIDDDSAFRLNLVAHSEDVPGRDPGENNRHGIYGANTRGFQRDTLVTLDYLHQRQDNVPDMGLPGDRETREDRGAGTGEIPSGMDFSNSYGHRDDYQRVDVDEVGLAVEHIFNRNVQVLNQTRYSAVDIDSVTSSPRIRTDEDGSLDGAFGIGDMKPRDQEDRSLVNQTDFMFNFDTAGLQHDLVAGFEVGRYSQENRRRPDVSGDRDGQRVDLFNPSTRHRTRPQAHYDRSTNKLEVDEMGVYVLDTISFNPQWDLNLGSGRGHGE